MRYMKRIGLVLILVLGTSTVLWPQTTSALLEKGIYTEETLGNLPEAIKIYQQVVADAEASRPNPALALFRLGMCYQKSGNQTEARASFARLAKLYPERKDLIAKIPVASESAPQWTAPPWIDGEVLQLVMKPRSGVELGLQVYRTDYVQEAGKNAWKLQSAVLTMSLTRGSSIFADTLNLAPIRKMPSYISPDLVRQARYLPGMVEISKLGDTGIITQQVPLERPVYDEDQLPHLLRCLPLAEGYHVTLPILAGTKISEVSVEVLGRERISVPAGSFDAFRIVLKFGNNNREQKLWISADVHRYIVKGELGAGSSLELRTVTIAQKDQAAGLENKEIGISLSAPVGWSLYPIAIPTAAYLIKAIDPDLNADCDLVVQDIPKDQLDNISNMSPSKLVETMSEMYAKIYKGYTVRAEGRDTLTVSGLPAARYIADLKHLVTGEDMVEYNIFLKGRGRAYVIKSQTRKENFDDYRPAFDFIVSSLKVQ